MINSYRLLSLIVLSLIVALAASEEVTAMTAIGNITGQEESLIFNKTAYPLTTFYGIPYAESPTGTRRFRKPVKKQPFTEDFRANSTPPICYQNTSDLASYGFDGELNLNEDCLFLNIFIPGKNMNVSASRAVMIWIYGGSFQTGYQGWYDGKALAAMNDVILVTINYRISVLGFLSNGINSGDGQSLPGNYGLWDQHMAIRWVHDHITAFGGNPNAVTIFGESAGSASVIYQALYEGNQGLFHRVIAQSGTASNAWALDNNPREHFLQYAKAHGCSRQSDVDIVACLQGISADALDFKIYFLPVLDGDFVKLAPKELFRNATTDASTILKHFGRYDLLMGLNSGEGGLALNDVDVLAKQRGDDISNGYSLSVFENTVIDVALTYAFLDRNSLLTKAIVHEYVDWYSPTNGQLMLERTVDLFSDIMFNAEVVNTINAYYETEGEGSLYFYIFDHKTNVSFFYDERYPGATHGDELIFVLGFPKGLTSLLINGSVEDPATFMTQEELLLSEQLMTYWTNFAKYGNPNSRDGLSSNLPHWPEYNVQTQQYIQFTGNTTSFPIKSHYAAARMHFWNDFVSTLLQSCQNECLSCGNTNTNSAYHTTCSKFVCFTFFLCAYIFS